MYDGNAGLPYSMWQETDGKPDTPEMTDSQQEETDENLDTGAAGQAGEQDEMVFLDFPIWWGEEPRIMGNFVEVYDLSGKTVIPFCTSGGSRISTAESELRKLCNGNPTWKKGRRFEGGASKSTVNKWVDSLKVR